MTLHDHPQGVPYWRLSGFYFLFFAAVGIFLPYWSLYLKSIGLNAEEIGILSAIVVAAKIFITYFWGWIVDHTGRRIKVMQLTALFSAISFSAALAVQSFWGLAFILFMYSLFWSALLPLLEAETFTQLGNSTHAYTRIRVWGSIGFMITVWLLGAVFEKVTINYVPLFCLISILIVWGMSLFVPEQHIDQPALPRESVRRILSSPRTLALLAVCFLVLASHAPYYTFYSIYLEDYGYSRSFIGQMWSLGVIAEVLVFLLMQRLQQFAGLRGLLLASLVLTVVRWLLIGFYVESVVILVMGQLLHAASFGIYHAVAIQYIHKFFPGRLQGRGQALYNVSSYGVGMALGNLVSGYVWESAGALACFTGAAAATVVALLIAWIWIKD